MTEDDALSMDPARTWELDVHDSAFLLGLAYVFPSVIGGVALLAVGLLAVLVGAALLSGHIATAVGLVVFAALSLLSRRFLPALLTTGVAAPLRERYTRTGLALGSVLGAAVLLGSARVHPDGPFVLFVASCVPLVLTAGFPTTGRASPDGETVVVDGTELPLEALDGYRVLQAGGVVVCWLSYPRGAPSAPRVVAVPVDAFESLAPVLERASSAKTQEASRIGRPQRTAAATLGVALLAVGPVLWVVLPGGGGRLLALYAGLLFGLLGGLLLWYAKEA